MTYAGKYPNRIRSVFAKNGVAYITTNDRKQYTMVAHGGEKLPALNHEISEYPSASLTIGHKANQTPF